MQFILWIWLDNSFMLSWVLLLHRNNTPIQLYIHHWILFSISRPSRSTCNENKHNFVMLDFIKYLVKISFVYFTYNKAYIFITSNQIILMYVNIVLFTCLYDKSSLYWFLLFTEICIKTHLESSGRSYCSIFKYCRKF